jgi:DNA-binding transcriptional ArsR family regulator/uncharacterized protein YndB with AHSA1/START domain
MSRYQHITFFTMEATPAVTPLHRALANTTRRRIVELLRERAYTTGELCSHFALSRFAVMQHIKVLESAGLLRAERRGRQRWNHLNVQPLSTLQAEWRDEVAQDSGDSAENALTVSHTLTLNVAAAPAFRALTANIGEWWPSHHASGAVTVQLELVVGGRFYESTPDGDGTLYAHVTHIRRNRALHWMGRMGLSEPATSFVEFTLTDSPVGGCELTVLHRVSGMLDSSTEQTLQQLWSELLDERLMEYITANVQNRPIISG